MTKRSPRFVVRWKLPLKRASACRRWHSMPWCCEAGSPKSSGVQDSGRVPRLAARRDRCRGELLGAHQRVRLALLLGQMEIDEEQLRSRGCRLRHGRGVAGRPPSRPRKGDQRPVARDHGGWAGSVVPPPEGAGVGWGRALGARPLLEAYGSASQRHIFYRYLAWQRALERRWKIDEQVIESARMSAASAKEAGEDADIYREKGPATAWAAGFLGWYLVLRGDVDEAEEQSVSSLSLADRSGDLILRAFCLSILVRVALRRHDKDAVRSLAPGPRLQVRPPVIPGVVAAKACLAWLAWQDGRPRRCSGVGQRGRGTFQAARGPTRIYKWIYIWPLVAVRLQEGKGRASRDSRTANCSSLPNIGSPTNWSRSSSRPACPGTEARPTSPEAVSPWPSRWHTSFVSFRPLREEMASPVKTCRLLAA